MLVIIFLAGHGTVGHWYIRKGKKCYFLAFNCSPVLVRLVFYNSVTRRLWVTCLRRPYKVLLMKERVDHTISKMERNRVFLHTVCAGSI